MTIPARITLHFGILTPAKLASRDCGRAFLRALMQAAPEWTPDKYNDHEPVNQLFNPNDPDSALTAWTWPFLWRRRRPRVHGSVFTNEWIHGGVYIRFFAYKDFDVAVAVRFLERIWRDFGVDLAYAHVTDVRDRQPEERYRLHVAPFTAALTTHELRHGLPTVPWAMAFGRPYVELFGLDRLLSAPAHQAARIEDGVYVQLLRRPEDAVNDRDAFLRVQREVTAHLNTDAFVGGPRPCRVPEFRFVEWNPRPQV